MFKLANSCHVIYQDVIALLKFNWCKNLLLEFLIVRNSPHSVQFSCLVMSESLWSHEWQHTRPPCPSPTPGVHWDSCPLSQWCHPAISSSVVPFSSCPQSLPASESFPKSQLFAWGGQSTGLSASASFPPKKSQGWSPSEWLSVVQMKHHILLLSIYCGVLYFGCVYYSDSTVPPFSFFYNLASTF